jgi:hypothetical protein
VRNLWAIWQVERPGAGHFAGLEQSIAAGPGFGCPRACVGWYVCADSAHPLQLQGSPVAVGKPRLEPVGDLSWGEGPGEGAQTVKPLDSGWGCHAWAGDSRVVVGRYASVPRREKRGGDGIEGHIWRDSAAGACGQRGAAF